MTAPTARRRPHPLRTAITAAGYTVKSFSTEIGIHHSALSAVVNYRLRPYPKLRRRCAETLGVSESTLFPETLDVVPYLKTLADARLEAGQPQRAAGLYRRALLIVERVSGAGHSDLEPFLLGLAAAQRAQGKPRDADTNLTRAKKVTAQTSNPGEIDEHSHP